MRELKPRLSCHQSHQRYGLMMDLLIYSPTVANPCLQNAWIEKGFTFDPETFPAACRTLVAFVRDASWNEA